MPIFYSLIAKDNDVILVEADTSSGNYPQITLKVLKTNAYGNGFKTFANSEYTYYLYNESPFTYLCLCETGFSKIKSLTFLKDIRDKFMQQFTIEQRESAITYSLNNRFERILKETMKYYSDAPESDGKINSLKSQMKDVENVMQKNLDDLTERGEKLELLVNTSKTMRSEALSLNIRANRLKTQKKWQYAKRRIIFCLLIWLFIYTAAALFCGGLDLHHCFPRS